jgi:hypothetical protein
MKAESLMGTTWHCKTPGKKIERLNTNYAYKTKGSAGINGS